MPRFGTKSLLIAFAVAALWLSSLSGYYFGADLRNGILLSIFVLSGIAAIYNQGRRRAFWAAFWAVILLHAAKFGDSAPIRYVPNFGWIDTFLNQTAAAPGDPLVGMNDNQLSFLLATIRAVWVLALATLVGYMATYIYDQSHTADSR
jgi:hypothetical protein